MIRLPIFILMWIGFLCIKIPTALSGFLMVPLLYRYRTIAYVNLPWWTRPWANPEDWLGGPSHYVDSLPRWWVESKGNTFKRWYQYHAVRNPANGLRSFEWIDLDIDPEKVEFRTNQEFVRYEPTTLRSWNRKTSWYIAWQGWQAGFKFIHIWNDVRHLVVKFGWRIEPADRSATNTDIGIEDASFASKILLYRKG